MRYPDLVRPQMCNTGIEVFVIDGTNRYGQPNEKVYFKGKCNWSEKARQVMTGEKQLVQLAASAYITGDIAPDMTLITGYAKVNDRQYQIHTGSRARNPDGTVNFTHLELI